MKSRFMLIGTPSGITSAPRAVRTTIGTPMIGTSVLNLLTLFAYADEGKVMHAGFDHMQADDGGSVYLRLSTRPIAQIDRDLHSDDALRADVVRGGYWRAPVRA